MEEAPRPGMSAVWAKMGKQEGLWWGSAEIGETQSCVESLGRCGPTSSELGSGGGRRLGLFPRRETGAFSLRCCWALSPLSSSPARRPQKGSSLHRGSW